MNQLAVRATELPADIGSDGKEGTENYIGGCHHPRRRYSTNGRMAHRQTTAVQTGRMDLCCIFGILLVPKKSSDGRLALRRHGGPRYYLY